MELDKKKELVLKKYEEYCKAVKYTTVTNKPMKKFDELPEAIQQSWLAAVDGMNGRDAYDLYCECNGYRTYDGRPTLDYDKLGDAINNAWDCFALCV